MTLELTDLSTGGYYVKLTECPVDGCTEDLENRPAMPHLANDHTLDELGFDDTAANHDGLAADGGDPR